MKIFQLKYLIGFVVDRLAAIDQMLHLCQMVHFCWVNSGRNSLNWCYRLACFSWALACAVFSTLAGCLSHLLAELCSSLPKMLHYKPMLIEWSFNLNVKFYGFWRSWRRLIEQYLQFGKKLLIFDCIYSLNVSLDRFALHRGFWYDFCKVTVRLDRRTIFQQDVYFALIIPTSWTWIEINSFPMSTNISRTFRLTWTRTLDR